MLCQLFLGLVVSCRDVLYSFIKIDLDIVVNPAVFSV